MTAVVTGWGMHVPGVDAGAHLGLAPTGTACAADQAKSVLGRRGLLYKEPATRLALCAVHHALGPGTRADVATAVVASSNLGNVGTVVDVTRTARADGAGAVSPLSAPNASSNVIAGSVAIWFGCGGPNLTLCSGATSGADALALALLLLSAGRADRVLVVGAEPEDDTARELNRRRRSSPGPLRAAAACVVLQRSGEGPLLGPVVPASGPGTASGFGETYGADGVLQVAAAAARLSGGSARGPVPVVCGDTVDGWRRVEVRAR